MFKQLLLSFRNISPHSTMNDEVDTQANEELSFATPTEKMDFPSHVPENEELDHLNS